MPVLTANPASLIAVKSCLNCMSDKQLKAVIVYVMRTSAGIDLPTLITGSSCYKCMSNHQRLVALTAMIANQLAPTLSVNDLRSGTPCKRCAASDSELESDMLFLFANYFQATPL